MILYLGSPDGLISYFLNQDLEQVLVWYDRELERFAQPAMPYDGGLSQGSRDVLARIVTSGRSALEEAARNQHQALDFLLAEFMMWYPHGHQEASRGSISPGHSWELAGALVSLGASGVEPLINHLSRGRPVLRDGRQHPYHHEWDRAKLGYLTLGEVRALSEMVNRTAPALAHHSSQEELSEFALSCLSEALQAASDQDVGLISVIA